MSGTAKLTVLCPLEFEQRALRRGRLSTCCKFHCCGPGAAGVEQWFRSAEPNHRPVILAGLAGGISPAVTTGSAYVVTRVIGDCGRSWTPNWPHCPWPDAESATVASTGSALTTPDAKASFARCTGADLVDMESAAFASAASAADCRWAVVRGVSDDAATSLPAGINQWVNTRGGMRPGRIAAAVTRRPMLLRDLVRLQRGSKAALMSVEAALAALVNAV